MVTIVVLGLCHRNNDLFGKIKSTRNVLVPSISLASSKAAKNLHPKVL